MDWVRAFFGGEKETPPRVLGMVCWEIESARVCCAMRCWLS